MTSGQETCSATPSSPTTIHFTRKGVLPPVYLAADFTEPPWDPIEMDFEADQSSDSAHFNFSKTFPMIKPGEHQYKFRLGPGEEGWTIDDSANMEAVDKAGHENNWVFVKSSEPLRNPVLSDPSIPIPPTSDSHNATPSNAGPAVLPSVSPSIDLDRPSTPAPQESPSSQKKTTPGPDDSSASTSNAMDVDKAATITEAHGGTGSLSSTPGAPQMESPPGPKVATMPVGSSQSSQSSQEEKTMTQTAATQSTQGTEIDHSTSSSIGSALSSGKSVEASITDDGVVLPRWTVLLRDDVPSDLSTDTPIHVRGSRHGAEERHDMHASMLNQYWDQSTGRLLPIEGAQMAAQSISLTPLSDQTPVATQDPNMDPDLASDVSATRSTTKLATPHKNKHRHSPGNAVRSEDGAIRGLRRDISLVLATAALCAILAMALYLLQDDDATVV